MTAMVHLWRPSPGEVLGGVVKARVTDRSGVVMIDVRRRDGSLLRWRTGYPNAAESLAAVEQSGELLPGEHVAIEHRREGQTINALDRESPTPETVPVPRELPTVVPPDVATFVAPETATRAEPRCRPHQGLGDRSTPESAPDPMPSTLLRAGDVLLTGVVAGRTAEGLLQLLCPVDVEGIDDIQPGSTVTIHGKTHYGFGGSTVRGRLVRAWPTATDANGF